jgi:predicted CXXCH cytochrome family protein
MARSSGLTSGVAPAAGQVRNPASGAGYRIRSTGRVEFERGDIAGHRDPAFYLGSGAAARTLLWQRDGFLFELPVTWFASRGWQMSPGYESHDALSLARPIEPECLNCHASGVLHRPGTQNGYEWPPVREAGVGCERCHGPGAAHAAKQGKGSIVNPAKLAPALRDSVCAQCHLTGVERVARARRNPGDFRPGEDLRDYAVSFVWKDGGAEPLHSTSHAERLAWSVCKKKAGDSLWCGSCHYPHAARAQQPREVVIRSACMGCHRGSDHAAGEHECVRCHMPSLAARDAPHAAFTDHSIPRRPVIPALPGARELEPFSASATVRDTALAWARIANAQRRPDDFERARTLAARAFDNGARDPDLVTALAFLEDRAGSEERAFQLYEMLRRNADLGAEGMVNLGSGYAVRGRLEEAADLWRDAVRRSPGLEAGWVKLATVLAALRRPGEAIAAVRSCLDYHPDSVRCLEIRSALESR